MKLWRKPLDRERVTSARGVIHIRSEWCKGCRYCVVFCPTQVLELASDFNAKGYHYPILKNEEGCLDCKLCERLCPEYSIVVTSVSPQPVAKPSTIHATQPAQANATREAPPPQARAEA